MGDDGRRTVTRAHPVVQREEAPHEFSRGPSGGAKERGPGHSTGVTEPHGLTAGRTNRARASSRPLEPGIPPQPEPGPKITAVHGGSRPDGVPRNLRCIGGATVARPCLLVNF